MIPSGESASAGTGLSQISERGEFVRLQYMALPASASAGPDATHQDTSIKVPPPLHQKQLEYPAATPMRIDGKVPTGDLDSAVLLEITIQHDVPVTENLAHLPSDCTLTTQCRTKHKDELMFYRPQMLLHKVFQAAGASNDEETGRVKIPNQLLPYVTLYSPTHQVLWSLTSKDWHSMEFQHDVNTIVTLSTLSSAFSFRWIDNLTYHWRLISTQDQYDLRCYHSKTLVAEITQQGSRFILWEQTKNPFRSPVWSSFLLLSGLLLHDHLTSMLRSLGGGPEALQIVMAEEDNESLGSFDGDSSLYYADQGLVDVGRGSVKSIELDPGVWRCWWGYGFWWTWCSCCMPGGWCDKIWMKCRWSKRKNMRTLVPSRRGWQQHHPEQY